MAVKPKATKPKEREKVNPETGLTPRQEEFCRAYLSPECQFNGSQAAIKAGYSKDTATSQASRLLTNVKVQTFLAELQKPAIEKFEITQERIMQEVASLAFSNIMDFITVNKENGQAFIDLSSMTRQQAAALEAFEVTELPPHEMTIEGQELQREVLKTKIKIRDKWGPLETLMKRFGLVKEAPVEVKHSFQDMDMNDIARRVAFMLRSASEQKSNSAGSGTSKSSKK